MHGDAKTLFSTNKTSAELPQTLIREDEKPEKLKIRSLIIAAIIEETRKKIKLILTPKTLTTIAVTVI